MGVDYGELVGGDALAPPAKLFRAGLSEPFLLRQRRSRFKQQNKHVEAAMAGLSDVGSTPTVSTIKKPDVQRIGFFYCIKERI